MSMFQLGRRVAAAESRLADLEHGYDRLLDKLAEHIALPIDDFKRLADVAPVVAPQEDDDARHRD